MHGALCAAQLLASAHSGKVDVDEAFLLVHPMDLRPSLRVPLAVSDLGMYSAGFQTRSAAVSKREFCDVARESKNQIEDAVARNEHLLTLKLMSIIETKLWVRAPSAGWP